MSDQQKRGVEHTPEYNVPGSSEKPISDVLISKLLTHRRAAGKQDGFIVKASVERKEIEEYGIAWKLQVHVSPSNFGHGESWHRFYETRIDAYLAFDWYVNKLGLEEQRMLPEDASERIIELRKKVLQDTGSQLITEVDDDE